MNKYDLHVHTNVSSCSRASPEKIVEKAVDSNLDGVVITDHDTVAGVSEVRENASEELSVVTGTEVTTTEGHILGIGVSEQVTVGEPIEVIEQIQQDGGIAVLAHPCDSLRQRFNKKTLDTVLQQVDAVEVINSRCLFPRFNKRASNLELSTVATTGGSDSHFPFELGRAYTKFPEGMSLKEAIHTDKTTAHGSGGNMSGHMATKLSDLYAVFE